MKKVVLASASPRRKELLENAGVAIDIIVSNIEEQARPGESPEAYAARNALEKAQAVFKSETIRVKDKVIIGCDTIVVTQSNKILEKPTDFAHAVEMLEALQGTEHVVISGLSLIDGNTGTPLHLETVKTRVYFRKIERAEIENYVASKEPMDKAGGYGAQGKGAVFIEKIEGSYSNVVGLPLCEVCEALKKHAKLTLFR